jgi:hypothetical protein
MIGGLKSAEIGEICGRNRLLAARCWLLVGLLGGLGDPWERKNGNNESHQLHE